MHHELTLITTVAAALGLALVCGFLAAKIRLPPLVGYLVAGILLGPATPGYIADVEIAMASARTAAPAQPQELSALSGLIARLETVIATLERAHKAAAPVRARPDVQPTPRPARPPAPNPSYRKKEIPWQKFLHPWSRNCAKKPASA